MKERHRALVVEDDAETAGDLVQILESINCASVVVDNAEDAEKQIQATAFCLVLLDLEIKSAPDSIKGHVEQGKRVLRTIRALHGDHDGNSFSLPVLIVSGFAREAESAVEVMKDGASDVIQKPLVDSGQVSSRIRQALQKSGRHSHEVCADLPRKHRVSLQAGIVIEIPGDRIRRRTRVTVGGNPVEITDASLRILLSLIVAHRKDTVANKADWGASAEQGFKGVSNLRNELKLVLGDVNIVESLYHGDYRFVNGVNIGKCAFDLLRRIENYAITTLVEQLVDIPARPKV
jgi:DNA-binding response OmpR family regulator